MRAAEAEAQQAQQAAAARSEAQQTAANTMAETQTPLYENLLNMGYPEATKNAMTTSEMGAAAAPFAEAGNMAENQAATTRNASGTAALEDQLALQKGQALGGAAANLQNQFQNEVNLNRGIGLQGLSNLYNTEQNAALGYNSSQAPLIQAQTTAANSSPWLSVVGDLAGAAGNIGAAFTPQK